MPFVPFRCRQASDPGESVISTGTRTAPRGYAGPTTSTGVDFGVNGVPSTVPLPT